MRVNDRNRDHASHGRAVANGVRLYYTSARSGDPVFLSHGVPKTSCHRLHAIPLLAPHYTVIAPDLRGLGDSQHPTSGNDTRNMAEDIHELLHDRLGPTHPAFVPGHDLGGQRVRRSGLRSAPRRTPARSGLAHKLMRGSIAN